jgi:hypothetical protein
VGLLRAEEFVDLPNNERNTDKGDFETFGDEFIKTLGGVAPTDVAPLVAGFTELEPWGGGFDLELVFDLDLAGAD